jgi:hypothetical protein
MLHAPASKSKSLPELQPVGRPRDAGLTGRHPGIGVLRSTRGRTAD